MNSLTAITAEHGHEGEDDDEWEQDVQSVQNWNGHEVGLLAFILHISLE